MDYTINKTVRTTFMDDHGLAVDGYRIYFTMADGTPDYVEISKAQYNKTNVEAAIKANIAVHKSVAG